MESKHSSTGREGEGGGGRERERDTIHDALVLCPLREFVITPSCELTGMCNTLQWATMSCSLNESVYATQAGLHPRVQEVFEQLHKLPQYSICV